MGDLRKTILRDVADHTVTAVIVAGAPGVVAGTTDAGKAAERIGLSVLHMHREGCSVGQGAEIARFRGNPQQIAIAEEQLLGSIAKPSGIATAARAFVLRAGNRPGIVSGAWKKMPLSLKEAIRNAVVAGGAHCRISGEPFVYLDKNYVEMLGGIESSLAAVRELRDHRKVIQLKGRHGSISWETCRAAETGADILFIDAGDPDDVCEAIDALEQKGLRGNVRIAFGGGIELDDMELLKAMDIDILDIGRAIIDAPLLDMKLDVLPEDPGRGCADAL